VLKAAPLLMALALAPRLGVLALALGLVAGSAGRLLIHLGGLAREWPHLSWPGRENRRDLARLGTLMAPLVVGVLFSQLSELADNFFSSLVSGGAVAARTYARRIADLPVQLVPYTLSVVAFPLFASLANRGEDERLRRLVGDLLRGITLLFAFLSVITLLLAEPVVALLFERGAFDAAARRLTAGPLRFYALGLVAFALDALLVPYYFALRDTRTPVLLGILGVGVNVGVTALLIGPMGVSGVAAALALSKGLKVLLLAAALRFKGRAVAWGLALASGGRILLAAGGVALALRMVDPLLPWPGSSAGLLAQVTYLAAVSTLGGLVYLAGILALPSPERQLLGRLWQAGLNRLRTGRGT
jgi:putative peptidoglycan lipid II flippase